MSVEIGIIGLAKSGKTTVFNAVSGANVRLDAFENTGPNTSTVKVPDKRMEEISRIYRPKKTTHALVTFLDAGAENYKDLSDMDALVFTVRLFGDPGVPHPKNKISPLDDARDILQSLVLEDMMKIETRMDRIEKKTGKKDSDGVPGERELLLKIKKGLEAGTGITNMEISGDEEKIIRGYRFLSQKPFIIAVNIGENQLNDAAAVSDVMKYSQNENIPAVAICGKIEMEISALPEEERPAFMEASGISASSRDNLIRAAYTRLNLISFFTVGEDEVRAWTVNKGSSARKAAGAIHSDIEKGFIRAEVVDCETLLRLGSWENCKREKLIRLEQKDYEIKDGDCVSFRFNV